MAKASDNTAPGLRTQSGRLYWRATKAAIKRGYPVKSVNLTMHRDDPQKVFDRCIKLQREQDEWLRNGRREAIAYDGTFATLLKMYETNPKSSFFKLKPGSLHPYKVYLRMLYPQIGHCHLDHTSGLDLQDWFAAWTVPEKDGAKRTVAKARMAMCVIRSAVQFGILSRLPGLAEFGAMLSVMEFEMVRPRDAFATAAEVAQLRAAAHRLGQPRAALAYALQFETTLRQWDVRGQWVDLSDKRPSAIIDRGKKWVSGPMWSDIDKNLILRWRPSKTDGTTGIEVVHDLKIYPMVMEELQLVPVEQRHGPLVIDMRLGRPHRDQPWLRLWRDACELVPGVDPYKLWNRDLRASGATEAKSGEAPAQLDDLKKGLGHTPTSDTAGKVYDRAKLEAARRVAVARQRFRNGE